MLHIDQKEAALQELAPVAEQLLNRHLETTKEWFPHEMVPWDRAAGIGVGPWDQWTPADAEPIITDEAVRSALYVNLLTEDNLPYYFHSISQMFGHDHPYG